jgi:hypothetical protein
VGSINLIEGFGVKLYLTNTELNNVANGEEKGSFTWEGMQLRTPSVKRYAIYMR